MSKKLGSWSGMRKYLEQEMLAESLKNQIRYSCTSYVGMDGCRVFEVFINDTLAKRFSWETVNTYFIKNGYKEDREYYGINEYWKGFISLLDEIPMSQRTEYTDEEFCEALEKYRNQPASQSIESENAIERMFAILDRRIGKRTLMALKDTINEQPVWLQSFYKLRFSAEAIEC